LLEKRSFEDLAIKVILPVDVPEDVLLNCSWAPDVVVTRLGPIKCGQGNIPLPEQALYGNPDLVANPDLDVLLNWGRFPSCLGSRTGMIVLLLRPCLLRRLLAGLAVAANALLNWGDSPSCFGLLSGAADLMVIDLSLTCDGAIRFLRLRRDELYE